jgi:hypothetical protein
MKTVELSDETRAALEQLPLLLGAPEFLAVADPEERYLALLAWCATRHASDFADFISHQESGHRYLMLTPDEVHAVRAHNHARQIDGTQFWAVMTIDPKSKRRFVRRLLEFIGCRDETVTEACRALGLGPEVERSRHLGGA